MAKATKLTAAAVAGLKPASKPYYVADMEDGLRLRVAPTGAKTWSVVARLKGGGVKSVSLGRAGEGGLSLADARERARAIVSAARRGVDLVQEEQSAAIARREALSLGEMVELYSRSISSPNRRGGALRTAPAITRRLKRALATKLDILPDELKRADISRLLDDVADRHPREAEARRQGLHALYAWALGKGYATTNPVTGMPTYGAGEVKDRALSLDEIAALLAWLDDGAANMPPDILSVLRLQIYLGARVGEIAGMAAEEFEVTADGTMLWNLPPERSKNKAGRTTPILGAVRVLIDATLAHRPSGGLFLTIDGERSLAAHDVGHALGRRAPPVASFTSHDLRRTVASRLDDLGVPLDTIAAVLGHQRGTAATRTLVRHYSRPQLDARVGSALALWERTISDKISGRLGNNVIQIGANPNTSAKSG